MHVHSAVGSKGKKAHSRATKDLSNRRWTGSPYGGSVAMVSAGGGIWGQTEVKAGVSVYRDGVTLLAVYTRHITERLQ